jgi:hypothetical protein
LLAVVILITRTDNHRIDSPLLAEQKPLETQGETHLAESWLPLGCRSQPDPAPKTVAASEPTDPELLRVVTAWSALPDSIRRAVLVLISVGMPPE